MSLKKFSKIVLKFCLLVAFVLLIVWTKQSGAFDKLLHAINSAGVWAAPLFVVSYILSCLLFFPSGVMTFASGALFPLPVAILLSLIGTAVGSTTALILGRYVLRGPIHSRASKNKTFQKLDHAIHREGWKLILLARLAPVFPFSIGNYLFGASKVPVWIYALTAFVGTIPSASVFALAGHMAGNPQNISGPHARTPQEWALLGIGIAATVVLSWYLKRFFERVLKEPRES